MRFAGLATAWVASLTPAAAKADGSGVVLDGSIALGTSLAVASSMYAQSPYEADPDSPGTDNFDNARSAAPYFAVDMALGGALSSWLVAGAVARAGVAGAPSPFTGELQQRAFWLVGPKLSIVPRATGIRAALMGGRAGHLGSGWGTAVNTSYDTMMPSGWRLGWGFEVSALWTRDHEDGDHGRYTYDNRVVTTSLMMTMRGR